MTRNVRVRRSVAARVAAARGKNVFRDEAGCASYHQGPTFTDVFSGRDRRVPVLHQASEVGMDPAYAAKSATAEYRTTPWRRLVYHPPYFHDGQCT